jgi:FkbM family methyltransferase
MRVAPTNEIASPVPNSSPCPPNPLLALNGAAEDLPKWLPAETVNCSCPAGLHVTASLPSGTTTTGEAEHVRIPAKVCRVVLDRMNAPPLILYGGDLQAILVTALEINLGAYGITDRRSTRALSKVARVVDIGANMGITSIAYALAHPHVTVHAYELNPGTFAFLQRNIRANGLEGRVIPHHVGLGSSDVPLRLSRCASVTRFGTQMLGSAKIRKGCYSSACKHLANHLRRCLRTDPRHVWLPTTTIASVVREVGPVGVMKVDCEGCEYDLLDDILRAQHEAQVERIVGECHPVFDVSPETRRLCVSTLARDPWERRASHVRNATVGRPLVAQSSSDPLVPALLAALACWIVGTAAVVVRRSTVCSRGARDF